MNKTTMNEPILYHYFERSFGPFTCFTTLPIDQARQILIAKRESGHFGNPDIDGFLQKRYTADKRLYEAFVAHGGLPQRTAPIYFMLGEHRQWESAYDEPCVIKIPLSEFDRQMVSFTYGDSYAIFNPVLYGEEEYWNKIYFGDEILDVIARHGYPPYVDYDFKRGIYPQDKHINNHLKYVEAHVWADGVLDRYKAKWLEENHGREAKRMTDRLFLIKPSDEYINEIRAYRQEFFDDGGHFNGDQGLRKFEDISAWIEQCRLIEHNETVPNPAWVEADQFMLVREYDQRVLGMINFRHYLSDYLAEYGGHIGYGIRPSERRKGYGKAMLALCLEKCRDFGLDKVLITCDDDNEASRRTIIACGGVFERTANEDGKTLERYWVALGSPTTICEKST